MLSLSRFIDGHRKETATFGFRVCRRETVAAASNRGDGGAPRRRRRCFECAGGLISLALAAATDSPRRRRRRVLRFPTEVTRHTQSSVALDDARRSQFNTEINGHGRRGGTVRRGSGRRRRLNEAPAASGRGCSRATCPPPASRRPAPRRVGSSQNPRAGGRRAGAGHPSSGRPDTPTPIKDTAWPAGASARRGAAQWRYDAALATRRGVRPRAGRGGACHRELTRPLRC